MQTLLETERKIIKASKLRLISYGDRFELFEYEKPYFYNKPPEKRSERGSAVAPTTIKCRREDNIMRTRSRVRRLIEANDGQYNEITKFITYTFKENIKSIKEANTYWKKYMKKIQYKYGKLKYITVIEFQERGAIHYHTLFLTFHILINIQSKKNGEME